MEYDAIVIGGGPAGISAALTLRRRNKSVAVITGGVENIPLYKSGCIDNYPGLPNISGRELLEAMEAQAREAGAEILRTRATSVVPFGESFGVGADAPYFGHSVILATGISSGKPFPGEEEKLGKGVSYCVTCDGMLYRGRKVCVVGFTTDAEEEAQLLRNMGCEVELFTRKGRYSVEGDSKVEALVVDGEAHPCEGLFILRPAIRANALLDGLEMDGVHISVDRSMATSVPGVFAAGDCVGLPYQVAKAVGDGNIAALSAARYLETRKKAE